MKKVFLLLGTHALCAVSALAAPLGTAFTYQGRLNDGGAPASGLYDLTFTLHDHPTDAQPYGGYIILSAVPVTNGLFNVQLNAGGEFGANGIASGLHFSPPVPIRAMMFRRPSLECWRHK